MSAHNNYGITRYGEMVSVEATCDEGHDDSYVIFPHENSKRVECSLCDEVIFIDRNDATATEILPDWDAVAEALG